MDSHLVISQTNKNQNFHKMVFYSTNQSSKELVMLFNFRKRAEITFGHADWESAW